MIKKVLLLLLILRILGPVTLITYYYLRDKTTPSTEYTINE